MSGALKHFFDSTSSRSAARSSDDGSAAARQRRARSRSGCGCTAATTRPGAVRSVLVDRPGAALDAGGAGARGARRGDRGATARGVRARRDGGGAADGLIRLHPGAGRLGTLGRVREGGWRARSRRTPRLRSSLALLVLAGCGDDSGGNTDPDQVDSVEPPELGACRVLTPEDVDAAEQRHQDRRLRGAAHRGDLRDRRAARRAARRRSTTSEELGAFAYETCGDRFETFLGADESLVMRTVVSWAWFRPSEKAWDKGARWYRCDIVGGGEQSKRFVELPDDGARAAAGQARRTSGWSASTATSVPVGAEDPLHRAARLAGGHDDQARPARRTPTPATGSSR